METAALQATGAAPKVPPVTERTSVVLFEAMQGGLLPDAAVSEMLSTIADHGPSFESRGVRSAYASVLAAKEQERRVSIEEQEKLKSEIEQVRERAKSVEFAHAAADAEQQRRVDADEIHGKIEQLHRHANATMANRMEEGERQRRVSLVEWRETEGALDRAANVRQAIALATEEQMFQVEDWNDEVAACAIQTAADRRHSIDIAHELSEAERQRLIEVDLKREASGEERQVADVQKIANGGHLPERVPEVKVRGLSNTR